MISKSRILQKDRKAQTILSCKYKKNRYKRQEFMDILLPKKSSTTATRHHWLINN
jgi:hypothetical protein